MSGYDNLKLKSGDIETAYLVVLTAIIEGVIESGAVLPDDLAAKISDYAKRSSASDGNMNVSRLAAYFEDIARHAKPRGE